MTKKLRILFNRAREIYQKERFFETIRRICTFIIWVISCESRVFYVYSQTLREGSDTDHIPKIESVTHRIVETVQQLDELSKEGFDLSLLDINQSRHRLERGAILSLVFVDHELGNQGWLALTKEAKKSFNRYNYRVDFTNHEACSGGAWTNPKYRRHGLHDYASYEIKQFLIAKGAIRSRSIVLSNNIAGQRSTVKAGAKLVAEADYVRIFGLQFWKEKIIRSTNDKDQYIVDN